MIVENPDAFKAWMTTVLEPLCDADPAALAKYVYALVKKDKPTEELHKTMVAQLEVFLQKETKDFVDFLFTKLKAGLKDEYTYFIKVKDEPMDQVEGAGANQQARQANQQAKQAEDEVVQPVVVEEANSIPPEENVQQSDKLENTEEKDKPCESSQDKEILQSLNEMVIQPGSSKINNGSTNSPVKPRESTQSMSRSHERKSDTEGEERERVYKLRRQNSSGSPPPPRRHDRSRSRSRSWDKSNRRSHSRSNRSRSRGWDRKHGRKNKYSPPRRYHRGRKMRSFSKSPIRSRSRTPNSRGWYSKSQKRSSFTRSRSKSRQSSSSPNGSSSKSRCATPTQDNNYGDDFNSSPINQNILIQSVVNVKEPISKKSRCRDYEEQGYCILGEMCPYDHGKDPYVVDDVSQVLSYPPPVVSTPPTAMEPPSPTLGSPMMQPSLSTAMAVHHSSHLMNRSPSNVSEYNPDAPSMEPRMWSKGPFRTAGRGMYRGAGMIRPPLMMSHHQRELISVPTDGENEPFYSPLTFGNPNKRQGPLNFSNGNELMPLKQRFDYSRLGIRKNNASLQLKKIPPGLNNIAHLHNHFVKFGTIVNIQVNFEGDMEAALITFTSHAEASAAYKSTEAVLNNRFIKVFWYNPEKDDKQENISPAVNRLSAKDRLGVSVNVMVASSHHKENNSSEKVMISGTNITKTFYIPQEVEKKPLKLEPKNVIVTTKFQTPQEVFAAREAIKKRKDQIRQEALTKTQELCQRRHEFLDNLIARQEELTQKLEKGNFTPEQRAEVITAIKDLQESIDTFRNGITPVSTKPGPSAVHVTPQYVRKSIEQTKKEILDAELDLINKEQVGQDSTELNKTIHELKSKAHHLGKLVKKTIVHHRMPRGSARFRTVRGRGGFHSHSTVDHRPTKLLVSGFESDDKVDVLEHFSKFGEVVDHVWDEATPALVIQFKTRKDAETAIAKGRNFQDRLMSVTWFSNAQSMGMRSAGMRSVMLLNENVGDLMSEHDEEEDLSMSLDTNEDILLQDEEEDEDEERTWRR